MCKVDDNFDNKSIFLLNKINFQNFKIQKRNFPIGLEGEKYLVVFFELTKTKIKKNN
jgi:hypothetical protein